MRYVGVDVGFKHTITLNTGESYSSSPKECAKYLAANFDVVCTETLEGIAYLENLIELISKECKTYGTAHVKVSKYFCSTQRCFVCGKLAGKLALDIRVWTCKICGTQHDRDVNAAKNILEEGLRLWDRAPC